MLPQPSPAQILFMHQIAFHIPLSSSALMPICHLPTAIYSPLFNVLFNLYIYRVPSCTEVEKDRSSISRQLSFLLSHRPCKFLLRNPTSTLIFLVAAHSSGTGPPARCGISCVALTFIDIEVVFGSKVRWENHCALRRRTSVNSRVCVNVHFYKRAVNFGTLCPFPTICPRDEQKMRCMLSGLNKCYNNSLLTEKKNYRQ